MVWPESIAVLATVGLITRRLLGLSGPKPKSGLPVATRRQRLCHIVTLELDAQSAILAVALNDAIEERDSGQPDLVWSTLHLATTQWVRQAETLALLLGAVTRYLPVARLPLPGRALVPEFFRSDAMRGYLELHDTADQFVFRNKPRFRLHVRALDEAVARLTADFVETQPGTIPSPDSGLWMRLDHDFHDFDLLTKETILTVRGFVVCLPPAALESFAAEVLPTMRRGVRASCDEQEHWDA